MKGIPSKPLRNHRGKVLLCTVVLAAQLVGCASTPFSPPPAARSPLCSDKGFPEDTAALIISSSQMYQYGHSTSTTGIERFYYHTVDKLPPNDCGVVTSGRHTIGVETRWSNGWAESTDLAFDAVTGRRYLALAFELQPGQDPATAKVTIEPLTNDAGRSYGSPPFLATGPLGRRIAGRSGNESTGEVIAKEMVGYLADLGTAGAVGLLSPILVPLHIMAGIYEEVQTRRTARLAGESADTTVPQSAEAATLTELAPPAPPTGRPFEGCCFVWIEDLDTGELITGIRPSGCAR